MKHFMTAAMSGISMLAVTSMAFAVDYHQAPALQAQVDSGALPPVAERLGAEPRIIEPVSEVGQYGGNFRGGMVGGNDRNLLLKFTGYEPLLAWDREWTGKVIPNVAKSYTASPDGKTFTFTLREGMKWSDGSPFTADDIVFGVMDVITEEKLFPAKPAWLLVDGKLPTVTATSPTEVVFSWEKPNGLFIANVAGVFGTQLTLLNKAYCSQFLPKYNDQADANAKAAGAADWAEYMINMCGVEIENIQRWRNPERPTIEAFHMTEPYVAGATRVAFERNPYYWKVDTAGNQLPYIDTAAFTVNADAQTLVLAVLAGDVDFEARHTVTTANLPLFAEGAEKGNFHINSRTRPIGNTMAIALNLNHKDPAKREIFANKDFRVALSHALDRQAIIDVLYFGVGEPKQLAPTDGTVFANERLARQFIEYDAALANQMLDALSLDKRDGNGFRTMKDGSPLVVNINTPAALGNYTDMSELIVQYWQAVGIDARLATMDRTRFYEEKNNNNHDVAIWADAAGAIDVLLDPRNYFPFSTESNYAVEWGKYFLGSGGEEPPAQVKQQWALYGDIKQTTDPAKQQELFQQILEISADQFYAIGVSSPPPLYAVVSNRLGNVPDGTPSSWIYPDPGPENPEQYYFKQ